MTGAGGDRHETGRAFAPCPKISRHGAPSCCSAYRMINIACIMCAGCKHVCVPRGVVVKLTIVSTDVVAGVKNLPAMHHATSHAHTQYVEVYGGSPHRRTTSERALRCEGQRLLNQTEGKKAEIVVVTAGPTHQIVRRSRPFHTFSPKVRP